MASQNNQQIIASMDESQRYEWYLTIKKLLPKMLRVGKINELDTAIKEYEQRNGIKFKQLTNLYISYLLNKDKYAELLEFIERASKTADADVAREVAIVNLKLQEELLDLLKSNVSWD